MSDDLKIRQPIDGTKVNVNQPWELNYWTKKLGVTEAELLKAVDKVGPGEKDIKKYLNK